MGAAASPTRRAASNCAGLARARLQFRRPLPAPPATVATWGPQLLKRHHPWAGP